MTIFLVALIAGRRMRYLVIVFWRAVARVGAAFAGKLGGLITSDTRSYVPRSAESTEVLDVQPPFSSPDSLPAIVIYGRSSGLTAGDQAKIAADVTAFGQRKDLTARSPARSAPRTVAPRRGWYPLTSDPFGPGWKRMSDEGQGSNGHFRRRGRTRDRRHHRAHATMRLRSWEDETS